MCYLRSLKHNFRKRWGWASPQTLLTWGPHNPTSRFQPIFTALISFSARGVILE